MDVHTGLSRTLLPNQTLRKRRVNSEPQVHTTKITTLQWGRAPYSITTDGIVSIAFANTKASITYSSSTTLPVGVPGFTTTASDPFNPIITQVVGVSFKSSTTSSSSHQNIPTSSALTAIFSTPSSFPALTLTTIYSVRSTSRTSATLLSASKPSHSPAPTIALGASEPHGLLSTGSTIGIAICVPILILGLFIAYVVWFIHHRRRVARSSLTSSLFTDDTAHAGIEKSTSQKEPAPHNETSQQIQVDTSHLPMNELGATAYHQEVDSIPRIELDSTPVLEQQHQGYPPSTQPSVYAPYRPADKDCVQSTQYVGVQLPSTYSPMPNKDLAGRPWGN